MNEGIEVASLVNFPITSNCYIVWETFSSHCLIIDPAQGEGLVLPDFLSLRKLNPDFIILTHEHFDHISSVEYLRRIYRCKVVSSLKCSEFITHPKKNLSLFYDQKGFACLPADVTIEKDNAKLKWQDHYLTFYLTPGHSEGSMCFNLDNYLFTGDTLIKGVGPVIKLPGGNREKLDVSINMLKAIFDENTIVFPGHGEHFTLKELDLAC